MAVRRGASWAGPTTSDELISRTLRAGALSYLLKETEPADLVRAVRAAAKGESVLHVPSCAWLSVGYHLPAVVEAAERELDECFAEWYAWAQRELGAEHRRALESARVALEAQAEGRGPMVAEVAARAAATATVLRPSDVPLRRQRYAEWYSWAAEAIDGEPPSLHAAARAALTRLDASGSAVEAELAARAAVRAVPAAAPPLPVPAVPLQLVPPVPPPPGPAVPPQLVPSVPPPPGPAVPPQPAPAASPPAGLRQRLLASAVDVALTTLLAPLLFFLALAVVDAAVHAQGGTEVTDWDGNLVLWGAVALTVLFGWLYSAVLESSRRQATLGKRLLGIRVTDRLGGRVSFPRASVRHVARALVLLTLGIGYLLVVFGTGRGLHDAIAGTAVVRDGGQPGAARA